MELSILTSKILAAIYISSGVGILLGKINFKTIAEDLDNSPALTFISGAIAITVGIFLLQYHNIWANDWTVLITLVGWAFLIGGIMVLIFPKMLIYFGKFYKPSPVWAIFMISFGLLFGYFGFFMQ